jgi:peptide deformylase
MLEIRTYPDPILKKKCRKISTIDSSIKNLAQDLMDLMRKENGVGIAAPQAGVSLQMIIVVDMPMINPVILEESQEKCIMQEGCLSFPGRTINVERPIWVKVMFTTIEGKTIVSKLSGFVARVFLHEYDHIHQTLFIERETSTI